MKHSERWLDALPRDAPERELIAAAERDFPPPGSVDRGWNALCAAVTITSASAAVSSSASASTMAAAATAGPSAPVLAGKGVALASAATSKTLVGLFGLPVAVKAIAVGFAVGVGALGTGEVVQSIRHSEPPSTSQKAKVVSRSPGWRSVSELTVANRHGADTGRERDGEPLNHAEPVGEAAPAILSVRDSATASGKLARIDESARGGEPEGVDNLARGGEPERIDEPARGGEPEGVDNALRAGASERVSAGAPASRHHLPNVTALGAVRLPEQQASDPSFEQPVTRSIAAEAPLSRQA
ncbi:MAG TPA: hypothetical protein VKP30_25000, partial [Polyangiaceae bacterium]|nr:hypothetical protein [Polyangiaceae bacterium]